MVRADVIADVEVTVDVVELSAVVMAVDVLVVLDVIEVIVT